MIVQWCCKGIPSLTRKQVRKLLLGGEGLLCSLLFHTGRASLGKALNELSEANLDQHLHRYNNVSGRSAFISLSAGCVSRDTLIAHNVRYPARLTALAFATEWGRSAGWLFTCYVLVGINPAPEIPAVAEEVRELNHARRFSPYFTEGEIAAKINVPSRQILCAEHWEPDGGGYKVSGYLNPRFVDPAPLVSERRQL